MPGSDESDAVRAGVHTVALALLPELPSIGEGVADHMLAADPGFVSSNAEDLIRGSSHANSNTLLNGLLRDLPMDVVGPPAEVLRDMREFVRRGVPVASVERAYRVGISWWCERWATAVQEHCSDPAIKVAVTSAGTTYLLAWMDHVLERVSAEARDESERLAREGALVRVEEVKRLLAPGPHDLTVAGRRLAYDVGGRHLAIVLHRLTSDTSGPSLEAAAREVAQPLAIHRPLVVRVDVSTVWCWIPVGSPPIAPVGALNGTVVGGHGRVGQGLDGFRSSHLEAQEALRVATLAGAREGTMTAYDRVALAALGSLDLHWAKSFVSAQLGTLAADDPEAQGLRDTLEAFFAANCGYRATAKTLGLHHNTVRYRLAQVERRLGRPLDDDRLALEVAVHLASHVGRQVLSTDHDHDPAPAPRS